MISARQVDPSGTRTFMGAITGGCDLHTALANVARHFAVQTATVELLGGLTAVEFTEYDFVAQQHNAPLRFERHMEIVSGHCTLSLLNDALHTHCHLALSFQDPALPHGVAVVAGHVAHATVYAVEFTLTSYEGAAMQRGLDAATGLQLWDAPTLSDAE